MFMMEKTIDSGFVPVLHKDAILDEVQDCTILSRDVIIHPLTAQLKSKYVVSYRYPWGLWLSAGTCFKQGTRAVEWERLGAVLSMLRNYCQAIGDTGSIITYFKDSVDSLRKMLADDLKITCTLYISYH